jgi:hypothetical protein
MALRNAADALPLDLASRLARMALGNVEREFPNKLDHVMSDATSVLPPRTLHPAFFGSFDWHSCVHAHWMLVRVLKLFPELPEAGAIRATLDSNLRSSNIDAEVAYLSRSESRAFERTYGWAWLLKLAEELACWRDPDAHRWSRDLGPLAYAIVARYLDYLPDATYPIRHGLHSNSAFGLAFALDFAHTCDSATLAELCEAKARLWYAGDRNAPASWEPSGIDFLSAALIEADLMRRILAGRHFGEWLAMFLPGIERREPESIFTPASVSDRGDPFIVHLDGLNLSRAWCWRAIAASLPGDDPRTAICEEAADRHLEAGMAGVASGNYAGDHWLATFAVFALTT